MINTRASQPHSTGTPSQPPTAPPHTQVRAPMHPCQQINLRACLVVTLSREASPLQLPAGGFTHRPAWLGNQRERRGGQVFPCWGTRLAKRQDWTNKVWNRLYLVNSSLWHPRTRCYFLVFMSLSTDTVKANMGDFNLCTNAPKKTAERKEDILHLFPALPLRSWLVSDPE